MFAFSPARKIFFSRPHLHELLAKRKVIEYSALHHIQYLEGMDGLAWRCHKLTKFNSNLDNKLFHGLYRYSKEKSLLDYIQSKKTIRLYLLMATEAQKAYKRLEKEYLESHFLHLDQGWDDRIDEVEAIKIEQSLKDGENESAEDVNS
jgi:pyoverdine/dityrosine biosynthesis protein Dit1